MPDIIDLTLKLQEKEDLTLSEATSAAHALASDGVGQGFKKEFLIALGIKGETSAEVAGFAAAFRDLARNPGLEDFADRAIDVVGTGGDKSSSFNISSVASFVVAAAGVPVLKHGNRSITSKSGSADFFHAMGIDIEAEPEKLRESVESLNFCFFFAPAYHPAFKEIMPVRRELAEEGVKTIFNLLGPLINPAKPAHMLMGVFSHDWVHPLAQSLDQLGLKRGLVVYSRLHDTSGMDELTCAGDNRVAGFGELNNIDSVWKPEMAGLESCNKSDLAGGSVEDNIEIFEGILKGRGNAGLVDTIVYNAGTALWIAGVSEGIALARDLLLGGAVKEWVSNLRDFYASAS